MVSNTGRPLFPETPKNLMRICWIFPLVMALWAPSGLFAETRMRLISPSYGIARSRYEDSGGNQFDINQYSVAADIIALETRRNRFPWLGLGTSVFGRSDGAEVVSIDNHPGGATLRNASYRYSALAPCVMLEIFPFPDLRPLEPFVEARLEIYEFSTTSLASPSLDRYRPVLQLGVRGATDDSGYFWGARITVSKRGYSGAFAGMDIPDPLIFGLQVDWIGLVL